MSDIYATLRVSPKKKRCPPTDDHIVLTPKKLRTAPPTPPASKDRRKVKNADKLELPVHLSRLLAIQTSLQHALSHALATCAVSPSQDTGIVRNVLNHLSLATYSGFTTQLTIDDLRRLCWIWEWDGKSLPDDAKKSKMLEDDNPFLDTTPVATPDWIRGAMGFVISPATHYSKSNRKRVPAYGIGVEVEMDIDKDLGGGMAAVARWTAAAEKRRTDLQHKLKCWVELHKDQVPAPNVPLSDIPSLPMAHKMSSLTRTLVSASPKACSSHFSLPAPPSSPSKVSMKSPIKVVTKESLPSIGTPSRRTVTKNSISFPITPSRRDTTISEIRSLALRTPSSSTASNAEPSSPSTPVHQRGKGASTAPQTPTTSRRQALYERVHQRSLSASPTKSRRIAGGGHGNMTQDELLKLSQEQTRRRCLLGRLNGVAESVWMLFSNPMPGISSSSTPSRKRRTLPASEVSAAIIKSSSVPISVADADESVAILTDLCPFFLRKLEIDGEDWLEMPAGNQSTVPPSDLSPAKKLLAPPSPGATRGMNSAAELLRRSPRSVKKETGGLREVREIIRREIELQD
ncbi:hypothetical protein AX17_001054 [Amanita inopinata Kibby_2008]|nr:hypothetical protein AX17_001054 [Amanita inopinata Kibby_2008]